jgi:hypothetical protein
MPSSAKNNHDIVAPLTTGAHTRVLTTIVGLGRAAWLPSIRRRRTLSYAGLAFRHDGALVVPVQFHSVLQNEPTQLRQADAMLTGMDCLIQKAIDYQAIVEVCEHLCAVCQYSHIDCRAHRSPLIENQPSSTIYSEERAPMSETTVIRGVVGMIGLTDSAGSLTT